MNDEKRDEIAGLSGSGVQRVVRPRAWWVCAADDHSAGATWQSEPTPEQLAWVAHATGMKTLAIPLGDVNAAVAEERERIKAAVTRCTVLAENCEGDGAEVDTARKSLACTILAAIAGYEAPAPAGTQQGLFGA